MRLDIGIADDMSNDCLGENFPTMQVTVQCMSMHMPMHTSALVALHSKPSATAAESAAAYACRRPTARGPCMIVATCSDKPARGKLERACACTRGARLRARHVTPPRPVEQCCARSRYAAFCGTPCMVSVRAHEGRTCEPPDAVRVATCSETVEGPHLRGRGDTWQVLISLGLARSYIPSHIG